MFSSKGKVLKYEKQKQESKLFTVHRLNIPIMDYWGCFTFAFEVSHVDSNISLETLEIHSSLAASEISHKQMNEFGNFLYKFFFLFFLVFLGFCEIYSFMKKLWIKEREKNLLIFV